MDSTEIGWQIISYGWYGISLTGLLVWLGRSHGGREAFKGVGRRENKLKGLDVLAIIFIYFAAEAGLHFLNEAGSKLAGKSDLPYIGLLAEQLIMTGAILFWARRRFGGGLGGFGVSLRAPGRTAGLSLFYFVMATGLTFLTLYVTLQICAAAGIDEVQRHETLEKLSEDLSLRSTIIIILTAGLGAPVMEELLFRGILQNYFIRFLGWASTPASLRGGVEGWEFTSRQLSQHRWLGIGMAGVLFAVTHPDWQHIPALLVLGVCLGYVYERRGNLMASIGVHSLFNIMQLAGTLLNVDNGG